ncbi:MAG TPA: hypothetical protein VMZ91_04205 [Candidatus Paceibacterota bacterium]|nr:hypothetical protein [Candidatus Paceibacterota bacterium]
MAKPIKFKAINPRFKIVNRCIYCGKVINTGFICSSCKTRKKILS